MTAPTLAAALDAVPPYVRAVALRLVEAAGGREPRIDYPNDEEGTGWTLTWSTPAAYVDVEFVPGTSALWFIRDHAGRAHDGGHLPADSIPEPLARALRSLA